MTARLSGKRAFITGAGQGIGRAIAIAVPRDFIDRGIRCNALYPGTTYSPLLEARIQASDDPEAMRKIFWSRQPMGRLGTVGEMAAAAVYLASDESAFMTGQELIIDGGQTL